MAIKNNIQEGTKLYSDCWRVNNRKLLILNGFDHYSNNNTHNFVDSTTGAHTRTIERLWGRQKYNTYMLLFNKLR